MEGFYTPASSLVNKPWSERKYCPRASTLLGSNQATRHYRLIPIRCRCWSCDYCAEFNSIRLEGRILAGKPTKFITLTTVKQGEEGAKQICKRVRPQIARLLSLIRKTWGPIEAAIILELTKKGLPHWHLCCRCGFIPQHWLSDNWQKLTGARIVDIRRIKNAKYASSYVAKYAGKTARETARAHLGRLYSFTSNYLIGEQTKPRDADWSFRRLNEHPLDVLRKWPVGFQVDYHDGVFDVTPLSSNSQGPGLPSSENIPISSSARPPPCPDAYTPSAMPNPV